MITSETPEQQELRYFASLLRTSEKTTSVIKKPEHINNINLSLIHI